MCDPASFSWLAQWEVQQWVSPGWTYGEAVAAQPEAPAQGGPGMLVSLKLMT